MKRCLTMLLAGAGSATIAHAQDEGRLEHILVSVPVHKKSTETALPVSVLTGDALRRAVAASLGETLGGKPGIANASFGPAVGRPVLRGQQGPRALSLVSGVSSADASSLSPDHAVAIEPLLADSIEVLRGPAALLYGGGAIGGAVNVVDGRIPETFAEDGSGAAGYREGAGPGGALAYRRDDASGMDSGIFRLDTGAGDFALHLSGAARDFDELETAASGEQATLQNTDGDSASLTGGFNFRFSERGTFGLSVNALESEYGVPPGAHSHGEEGHGHGEEEEDHDEDAHEGEEEEGRDEDEHAGEDEDDHAGEGGEAEAHGGEFVRIDLEQTRYDARLHLRDLGASGGNAEALRLHLAYTDYRHLELEGDAVGTRYERETWEARLELAHSLLGHGAVGLQWRSDDFLAAGGEAYIPQTRSRELGLFFVEDAHAGDWTLEFGARVDYAERKPQGVVAEAGTVAESADFTSLSLTGSALWAINPEWQLSASLSSSERAPATEELFSNAHLEGDARVVHGATGLIEVGDPGLDEEASLNLELSLNWRGSAGEARLTAYRNDFDGYIFLLDAEHHHEDEDEAEHEDEHGREEEGGAPVYEYHGEDALFTGVELESRFTLGEWPAGRLELEVFGDLVRAEFDDSGDVPRMPPNRLGGKLAWHGEGLGLWLSVLRADDQDDPGEGEAPTDGYTRWDLGADYRWRLGGDRELTAFLHWKNLTDEEIRLSTSFLREVAPQAGESVEAGLRFRF